jgi:hypothetical protein
MSLKTFHLVFISASTILAFWFSAWLLQNYASPEGRVSDLIFGILSALSGVGLIVYECYFLKKTRNVSYL